eukprot:c19874_g1_i1.p1 GENE.c19874_g1_i1~~c19874_g1_i1.p1  ORF type:complete len:923 (+),score=410.30 c19874_g1_i1:48-2816(+)
MSRVDRQYDGHPFKRDDDGSCIFCTLSEADHVKSTVIQVEGKGAVVSAASLAENQGALMSRATILDNKSLTHPFANSQHKQRTGGQRNVVYAFGDGEFGKLGHGSEDPQRTPKMIPGLHDQDIIQIECGHRHTVALSSEGSVFTWGHGGSGQLGHGDTSFQSAPRLVEALKKVPIALIAAGGSHTCALSKEGRLYTWGENSDGQLGHGDTNIRISPTRVEYWEREIVIHVSAGLNHTACVTDSDEVYTWGNGDKGKLGHGDDLSCKEPKRVRLFDANILQVRCYDNYTLAMTIPFITIHTNVETGSLLAAPEHENETKLLAKVSEMDSQLSKAREAAATALQDMREMKARKEAAEAEKKKMEEEQEKTTKENLKLFFEISTLKENIDGYNRTKSALLEEMETLIGTPLNLDELVQKGIHQLAFGKGHMLFLLSHHEVFAYGDNRKGQLGFGTKDKKCAQPERIRALDSKEVKQIACGDHHSVALTFTGHVWTWGDGSKGQLGLGKKEKRNLPAKVRGALENERAERIGCTATATFALTARGEVFVWGIGDFAITKSVTVLPTNIRIMKKKLEKKEEVKKQVTKNLQNGSRIDTSLTKADIKKLLDMGMNVEVVENMYPEVQADAGTAYFLAQEINRELRRAKILLQDEITVLRQRVAEKHQEFINDQEKALEERDAKEEEKMRNQLNLYDRRLTDRVNAKLQLEQDIVLLTKEIEKLEVTLKETDLSIEMAQTQTKTTERAAAVRSKMDMAIQIKITIKEKSGLLQRTKDLLEKTKSEILENERNSRQTKAEVKRFEEKKSQQFAIVKDTVKEAHDLLQSLRGTALPQLNASIGSNRQINSSIDLIKESNIRLDEIEKKISKLDVDEKCDTAIVEKLQKILRADLALRREVNKYSFAICTEIEHKKSDEENKIQNKRNFGFI